MAATTYPIFKFADSKAGLAWLLKVLGYDEVMVVTCPETGIVKHGELKLGNTIIMTGQLQDQAAANICSYTDFASEEALAAYVAGLKAKGANITKDIYSTPYGSKECEVQGPEGSTWSFGTYKAGSYSGPPA